MFKALLATCTIVFVLTGIGCSTAGPPFAAIGSGHPVTSLHARNGIEKWLSEQDVEVVSKDFGSVDGELVFKTRMGHANIVKYHPYRDISFAQEESQTFVQVIQHKDQQETYVDQNYIQGLQQQLLEYIYRERDADSLSRTEK